MQSPFERAYPAITRWVQAYGHIHIGVDEFLPSFVRAIDEGGMIWEGRSTYSSMDEALRELEQGIAAYMQQEGFD
jgi:hypothetical protein